MKRRTSLSAALIASAAISVAGCDRFTSVDTRMSRATASLSAGEYQAALVDLRKVLDAEPQNTGAQLLLVDVLKASGDIAAARVQLDRALDAGAPASETEPRQLDILLSMGSTETLRKTLESATTLSAPRRAIYEGRLLLLERRPAEAQVAFERVLAADQANIDAASGKIEAMAAQGNLDAAAQYADTLLEGDSQSGRIWFAKGLLAARIADFATASEALTRAISSSGELTREQRIQAHVVRLESQIGAGELASAHQSLAALEAEASDVPITSMMRARVALAGGDPNAAVNDLRRFSQAAPQHLVGRLLLITALQEQGSMEQAFAEAVRAVSEFPSTDEPRLALAGVQLRMGRAADAEGTLQSLIAKSPPNPIAMSLLAEIRVRSGNAAAGISMLEQSLAESPNNGNIKLQLATAQIAANNAQRALQVLDTVRDPELLAARDRLRVIATAALQGSGSAEQELRAAVQRHPDDVDLMLMAAAYASNTGKLDQAREHLNKALEARPGNPMLMQSLAKLELSAGRVAEALALANTSLEKAPNDAAGMVLMASIAALRGQDSEVDAWLNKARVANPGALEVSLALARRAAVRGDAAQARSILSEAADHSPSNPGIRVALAELIASEGNPSQALAELREAARLNPESALIALSMARIHLSAGETTAARSSLNQSLKLSPGWLPASSLLAQVEVQQGNLTQALEVVHAVRTANPKSNVADILTGDIYMAAGRPVQASAAYTSAYKNSPDATAATKAIRSKAQAGIRPADVELLDWLKRAPDDSGARRVLAEYYLTSGANAEAIVELERVVSARPADAIALNNLAWLYQRAGDERALKTAENAFKLSPQVAAIADTYGWILTQTGNSSQGAEILSDAATSAPENPQIQLHLAEALVASGKPEAASRILDTLLAGQHGSEILEQARALKARLE